MLLDDQQKVWINGSPEITLPVTDRGLAYGDGVFETIRVSKGKLTLANYHWQRLKIGCRRLKLSVDIGLLLDEVDGFISSIGGKSGIIKIIITRGNGGRGYNPEGCNQENRILIFFPLPLRIPDPAYVGARVKSCQLRIGKSDLAGIKHLNRLDQVMARAEWQGDDFDEGLMCDDRGFLLEGTMSNLFLVTHDKRLLTPNLSRAGIDGVCRQYILDNASQWSIESELVDLVPTDITAIDISEIFLCNSVVGVWPVTQYMGQAWDIGTLTTLIREQIQDVLYV